MTNHICGSTQRRILLVLACIAITSGCTIFEGQSKPTSARTYHLQPLNGEAEILQSWQGDYPVDKLQLLPEKQREQAIGFIDNAEIFAGVWKAFMQGEAVPEIDFKINLVLFARNTQFFNRTRISKVNVKSGVAEVLAMETRSAMPIEDKVAMSLVVVAKQGITAIQSDDQIIPIN